jgi:hypothetical protein
MTADFIDINETDDAGDCRFYRYQLCLCTAPSSNMCHTLPFSDRAHILLCIMWPSKRTTLCNFQLYSIAITYPVLQEVHSVLQSEFSTQCDLVLPLSNSSGIHSDLVKTKDKLSSRRIRIQLLQERIFNNQYNQIYHLTLPVGLPTLSPSRASCLEIPGDSTSWSHKGLYSTVQGKLQVTLPRISMPVFAYRYPNNKSNQNSSSSSHTKATQEQDCPFTTLSIPHVNLQAS